MSYLTNIPVVDEPLSLPEVVQEEPFSRTLSLKSHFPCKSTAEV